MDRINEPAGQSWVPERRVFVRRTIVVAAVTLLFLVCVGLALSNAAGFPIFWIWPTSLLLTLGFLIDDLFRWRIARLDRWMISEGHLHHQDATGTATIPLNKISSVHTRFGSRVVVVLTTAQKLELRFLRDAKQIAEQINAVLPASIHESVAH